MTKVHSATRVTIAANARLHLGFLDLNGGLGRKFGSIGLCLDQPGTVLSLKKSRDGGNRADGIEPERALRHLEAMTKALGLRGGFHLDIAKTIPAHIGLGSGTQLALAIGAAVRKLSGLPLDTRADALLLQRGARSGIGAALFEHGGLVVDGGQGAQAGVPPVLARVAYPENWRIILIHDKALQGLHGANEPAAFAALPPFPATTSAEICRLVLMQALPAIAECDIAPFGAAITRIQALLGDHFAPAQGGRFTSPRVAAALAALHQAGAAGVGQSSWGPTGFAFAESQQQAQDLAARAFPDMTMQICRGCNASASITQQQEPDA